MKIPVEPPFDSMWKHAYVVKNSENRNMVCLVNGAKDRTTMALARYKMAVKLGRMLRDDEQVDHIDNDKTNDAIDNLQILTAEQNISKYLETVPHHIHGTRSMYRRGCRCPACRAYKHNEAAKYKAAHPEKQAQYLERRKQSHAVEKKCEFCGAIFYRSLSHKNTRFCSKHCAMMARHHG